ncbi:MdtA/MuxA family multidrug efflux RND transporter periplasmic adaptor subunit [uncultured Desulfovibrio sp.]|uniref:MdtA/MuxA family multidrug efflux RND transporter periplasmic adaptor subunit n=1 Tax=uncultured Desulfovibrio sp. TaxID=167968 RepID=UPI002606102A|nr:MdtA/MuxA family multidrug efflux RND transporter periplasmic adaptor subunit [uncultured Desulfovibrio sp.]
MNVAVLGKSRWVRLALVLLVCILLYRIFWAGDGGGPRMQADLPPVRVATALAQDVPFFLGGMGTVEPSSDVLVTSRVDGQLWKLHFHEGQRVQAGDLLAEIDPRPFEAELAQARGNLLRDEAQLANARNDLSRYARLVKNDYVSAQQYETQRALVKQYEGTVAADKAAVQAAELQLVYSRITAPVGGRLGLRKVDLGNMVRSTDSEGLVRITEVSPCHVLFTLPENQVQLVRQALLAHEQGAPRPLVQAWDRENKARLGTGELLSMDNQIDSSTGTVKLKALFPNKDAALYPQQFVNARVLVRMLPQVVTVPTAAVQLGSQGSYVYVLDKDSKVRLRQVTPGVATNLLTVIDKGLAAGEQVVVDGLDRLRDGIAVSVAATMETPPAESVQ